MNKKSKLILISAFGLMLMIIGFYLIFWVWTQNLMNLDYNNINLNWESLIFGCILIGIGMYVFTRPIQIYLGKWGVEHSFDKIRTALNAMTKNTSRRQCIECGREIPFDANLCPYCAHDYR